jgi:CRISPR-associated exonuclease Cas4
MLVTIAAGLLLVALLVIVLRPRVTRQIVTPAAVDLLYSDTEERDEGVLLSPRYGLVGKPDALVRLPSGDVVPVERKSGRAPKRPYEGDLAQATVYCILVEDLYGRTPPFMRLQYADRAFDEPFTPARKQSVLQAVEQLRRARALPDVKRSHAVPAKCRGCGQRRNCDQAL